MELFTNLKIHKLLQNGGDLSKYSDDEVFNAFNKYSGGLAKTSILSIFNNNMLKTFSAINERQFNCFFLLKEDFSKKDSDIAASVFKTLYLNTEDKEFFLQHIKILQTNTIQKINQNAIDEKLPTFDLLSDICNIELYERNLPAAVPKYVDVFRKSHSLKILTLKTSLWLDDNSDKLKWLGLGYMMKSDFSVYKQIQEEFPQYTEKYLQFFEPSEYCSVLLDKSWGFVKLPPEAEPLLQYEIAGKVAANCPDRHDEVVQYMKSIKSKLVEAENAVFTFPAASDMPIVCGNTDIQPFTL